MTNKCVPFCCILQKVSSLPETEPQFGPVKKKKKKEDSNMKIINGRERRRIKMKRGVLFHLLSDVDLRQPLQLGGVFWHICGQQTHTANKDLQGKHVNVTQQCKVHTCRIHL